MTNIKCSHNCAYKDPDFGSCSKKEINLRVNTAYKIDCEQFLEMEDTDHLVHQERVFPLTRGDRKFLKEVYEDDD